MANPAIGSRLRLKAEPLHIRITLLDFCFGSIETRIQTKRIHAL